MRSIEWRHSYRLWLPFATLLLVLGCAAGDAPLGGNNAQLACSPGQMSTCFCEDGTQPQVQCGPDGNWTACSCATAPAACTPPQSATCTCPDGAQATAQCQADGTFGACPCPAGAGGGGGGPAPPPPPAGALPCDVQTVLEAECHECHGTVPQFGAPTSLVSVGDLAAKSLTQPDKAVSELMLEKIQSTATGRMPPAPREAPEARPLPMLPIARSPNRAIILATQALRQFRW